MCPAGSKCGLIVSRPRPRPSAMVFAPALPLLTERLSLRPFTRGDVDAVYLYRQREDVTRHLFDAPMSREQCTELVQTRVGQTFLMADEDSIVLAIERRDDQHLLGEISLILRSAASRQGELGYLLHPDAQHRGYATEAAARVLELGFAGAGLHRIYARCSIHNLPSWHLMERLGLRREAHLREHVFIKGEWAEELVYAQLEEEWRARWGMGGEPLPGM
jgi:RimJ/RimL family protein N-acetyltransferase